MIFSSIGKGSMCDKDCILMLQNYRNGVICLESVAEKGWIFKTKR